MTVRNDLAARCNDIEEAYEFMLAYAAQGLATDAGSSAGGQVRQFLGKLDAALTGLGDAFRAVIHAERADTAAPHLAFVEVIDRDSAAAQAAVRMVLAQAGVSSQMVDNLNASIHLRALLTDIFLADEVLKAGN